MAEIQLFIESSVQGKLKGEDQAGKITCLSYHFDVVVPRTTGGQASGKRQYSPLTVIKELSAASPQLAQALVTNETLTSVTLKFFQGKAGGKKAHYYTITLQDASVSAISQAAPLSNMANLQPQEEISFTFGKIEWTWVDGGITASDDWESANV